MDPKDDPKDDKTPEEQRTGADADAGDDDNLFDHSEEPLTLTQPGLRYPGYGKPGHVPPQPRVPLPYPEAVNRGEQQAKETGEAGGTSSGHRKKRRSHPPKAKDVGEASAAALKEGEVAVLKEGEQPRKKAELAVPEVPMACSECGMEFSNYKDIFEHMRSHPTKVWRASYPPPPPVSASSSSVGDIKQQGELLASTFYTIAKRLIEDGAGTTTGNPRGLDLDLNVVLETTSSETTSSSSEDSDERIIDLSKDFTDSDDDF